jgi:hypothetical protein
MQKLSLPTDKYNQLHCTHSKISAIAWLGAKNLRVLWFGMVSPIKQIAPSNLLMALISGQCPASFGSVKMLCVQFTRKITYAESNLE